MRVWLLPLGLLAGALACTTDPDEPIATSEGPFYTRSGGSFDKLSLTPTDGAGIIESEAALGAELEAAGVKSRFRAFVEDKNSVCGLGAKRQNATVFAIDALSDSPTFAPGTYTQKQSSAPGQVDLSITKLNATCGSDQQDYGTESGTVTITSVTATVVTGTFDVTLMGGAGTLSGSFNVPLCPSLRSESCDP